jgi:hypothetical protein
VCARQREREEERDRDRDRERREEREIETETERERSAMINCADKTMATMRMMMMECEPADDEKEEDVLCCDVRACVRACVGFVSGPTSPLLECESGRDMERDWKRGKGCVEMGVGRGGGGGGEREREKGRISGTLRDGWGQP